MSDEVSGVVIKRFNQSLSPATLLEDSEDVIKKEYADTLRPTRFVDYPGQNQVKENLKIYVEAARKRDSVMDHVILHGPPGLGKTTLARILAYELDVPFCSAHGATIEKQGDLAGLLAGLRPKTLFFIDEIHRLPIQAEELLYTAMEDFSIDIIIGQGPTARSVSMPVAPFTLIGATTRLSKLSRPFLSRFGIQERLEFYDAESLQQVILRSADIMRIGIDQDGAFALAMRSRGTPRIANRLLRRVADFALVLGAEKVDALLVDEALRRLDIDKHGLDRTDREFLRIIAEQYDGGPVGIETIAVTMGEEKTTLEDVYEPYLIYSGFLTRGPRGRSISKTGLEVLMH